MSTSIEDWENAAQRLSYISNTKMFEVSYLMHDFQWLGRLTIYIDQQRLLMKKPGTPITMGVDITMLSRLWVLQAYEIVRSIDETDEYKDSQGIGYFKPLKHYLEELRIPLAKYQMRRNSNANFVDVRTDDADTLFILSSGATYSLGNLIERVLIDTQNYVRPT